jgi:hypothetical protein
MGLGEKIRKQVGRPRPANPLQELQTLNDNLRSLGSQGSRRNPGRRKWSTRNRIAREPG